MPRAKPQPDHLVLFPVPSPSAPVHPPGVFSCLEVSMIPLINPTTTILVARLLLEAAEKIVEVFSDDD